MDLRPDLRKPDSDEERAGTCRRCGTALILLPDDRRQGYCFDCYDPLEVPLHSLA